MSGILEGLVVPFENLAQGLVDLRDTLVSWLKSLVNKVVSVASNIIDLRDTLVEWLGSLVDRVLALPTAVWNLFLEGLQFLFIPSDGYFEEKITDTRERFLFVDGIINTAESLYDFFASNTFNTPPSFEVDLGNANSKYNWGGKALVLDFSWYVPYKPTVDALLSGILWVVFVWNTYKGLPSIISGVGSAGHSAHEIKEETNAK